jgi:hypothetical protein
MLAMTSETDIDTSQPHFPRARARFLITTTPAKPYPAAPTDALHWRRLLMQVRYVVAR